MATVNALRDVDPIAITLCKKGANRQRIFLMKSGAAEPDAADLMKLRDMTVLRKDGGDWSAIYCVVAVPGAEEDPGLVGEAGSTDVWESEDEIRKAAHRLLKNGGYVNTQHDGEATPGCTIVESAIALGDFTVVDPTGTAQTIQKGSWYVAIEPNDDLRKSIEDGSIESISMEGTGVRVAIEKDAKDVPNKPKKKNWVEEAGGLPKKIADMAGDLITEKGMSTQKAIATAVSQAKKLAPDHPEWAKAVAQWEKMKASTKLKKVDDTDVAALASALEGDDDTMRDAIQKAKAPAASHRTCKNCGAHMATDAKTCPSCGTAWVAKEDRSVLRKLWEGLFPTDAVPAQLRKTSTFSERIAEADLRDASWRAFDTLQSVIYDAVRDEDEDNPQQVIRTSIDEFRDYLLGKLDQGQRADLAKELGTVAGDTTPLEDDVDEKRVKELIEEATQPLAKSVSDLVEALPAAIKKAVEDATPAPDPEAAKQPTIADLQKTMEDYAAKADERAQEDADVLTTLAKQVQALAEGGSTQDDDPETLRKSKDPLAGILLD